MKKVKRKKPRPVPLRRSNLFSGHLMLGLADDAEAEECNGNYV
jgi:hypothetical protein